ncbi:MAG: Wzz/FepE/Etk N-terminal domain-containing protein [Gammaproteobacteria bacterium]|nr:MAG: Wzz/FepE/Etk N-terminal domain-containing protein [Gammaproteobacteria bacterium]
MSTDMEEGISLLDIWRILIRHKLLILGTVLVCTLASIVLALVMTPVYRAEIQVAPVSGEDSNNRFAAQLGELGGLAALSGINMEQGSKKNESIATLRSRRFTEQFIKDEKLLPVLFHDKWDAENQRWDETDPEDIPTLEDAWKLFNKKIRRISEDRKTGLVVLSIEWEDPGEAAHWANELVSRVNEMLRKKAATDSENAIGYLREQLGKTSVVELKQVVNRLIESEMKEIILANITREYAFRVIDPAVVPEDPFKPVMVLMVVFGIAFGAVLGIILAVIFSSVRAQRDRAIYQSN